MGSNLTSYSFNSPFENGRGRKATVSFWLSRNNKHRNLSHKNLEEQQHDIVTLLGFVVVRD